MTDKNATNGMLTKIWGPHLWESLHSISFGYPLTPTDDDKEHYKTFLISLGYVLPCKYCRESYQKFIKEGVTKITDDIFESRATLTKWVYEVHEIVNRKLGMDYGMTYDELCDKYESYRAKCVNPEPGKQVNGCNMPLDLKAESFRKGNERNAPIINRNTAECFIVYGLQRGIDIKKGLDEIDTITKGTTEWTNRNNKCWEIINKMRLEGIPAIEMKGEFKGKPTIEELKLISMKSSTMNYPDIHCAINKLGYKCNLTYEIII